MKKPLYSAPVCGIFQSISGSSPRFKQDSERKPTSANSLPKQHHNFHFRFDCHQDVQVPLHLRCPRRCCLRTNRCPSCLWICCPSCRSCCRPRHGSSYGPCCRSSFCPGHWKGTQGLQEGQVPNCRQRIQVDCLQVFQTLLDSLAVSTFAHHLKLVTLSCHSMAVKVDAMH